MSDPLHDVFEILQPPPGGLAELQRRVQGERTPRRAWLGGLALVAAAAAVLVVASPRTPEPALELADQLACADPALAGVLCAGGEPGAVVSPSGADRLALALVPNANDRVLIYRVAGAGAPMRAGQITRAQVGLGKELRGR